MMKPSVHVLDGLAEYLKPLQLAAGAAAYTSLAVDPGVLGDEDMHLISPAPLGPSEVLSCELGRRVGARFRLITASLRLDSCAAAGSVHVVGGLEGDHRYEVMAANLGCCSGPVPLFNSPNSPGLAFWRHNSSGLSAGDGYVPPHERFNLRSWSMQSFIHLEPGRAVLMPASAYVSMCHWDTWAPSAAEDDSVIWAAYVTREQ